MNYQIIFDTSNLLNNVQFYDSLDLTDYPTENLELEFRFKNLHVYDFNRLLSLFKVEPVVIKETTWSLIQKNKKYIYRTREINKNMIYEYKISNSIDSLYDLALGISYEKVLDNYSFNKIDLQEYKKSDKIRKRWSYKISSNLLLQFTKTDDKYDV